MKKLSLLFLICFFLQNAFAQAQKNDSSDFKKNRPKFLFGIEITPNYCWRGNKNPKNGNQQSIGNPEYDKPFIGYGLGINETCKFNQSSLSVGIGFNYLSFIWNYHTEFNGEIHDERHLHQHYFLYTPFRYSILFGKNEKWFSSFLFDISYLFKFDIIYHLQLTFPDPKNNYEQNITENYFTPQLKIFGGGEIGRTILTSKWMNINTSASFKYSSLINGDTPNHLTGTYNIHLIVYSLNLVFYPKIHLK